MNESKASKYEWHRSPVPRAELRKLNQRSDWRGLLQTFGHLGLLLLTGGASWYTAANGPLWALPILLFAHGTFYAFLLNGFHELCHKTVFKTKWLNVVFLRIFSFLGWYDPVMFWESHQAHHKYTLHPPDDLEVVLPTKITLKNFLQVAFINPWGLFGMVKSVAKVALGKVEGEWANLLFPPEATEKRRRLFNWARTLLIGHALLVTVSIALGWWMLPVLTTLAPFYGGWLLFLCNNAQHSGMQDNVPDYRLNTRTILLNPFVQFLYWHMNFHIEHHMYAAVPCYHLGKLHRLIRHDLPYCPNGLFETWRQIIAILQRQKEDPGYVFAPELPARTMAGMEAA